MRPFGPLPATWVRSTPSSRANLRTDGDACGRLPGAALSAGSGRAPISVWKACDFASAATAGAGAGTAAAGAGAGAGAGAALAQPGSLSAGAGAPASASSTSSSAPSATLSPSLTFISFTTPAADDGISIDALSLSTVTSDCSFATVSPGFTRTSITSTSLKSPMSGTFTSTSWPISSALSCALFSRRHRRRVVLPCGRLDRVGVRLARGRCRIS